MAINTNYYNYSNYLFNSGSLNKTSSIGSIFDLYNAGRSSSSKSSSAYTNNTSYQVSETVQNFISNAKLGAFNVKSTLNAMMGNDKSSTSSFSNKKIISSDNSIMSIKSVDTKKSNNATDKTVTINQTATVQKNAGTDLTAKSSAVLGGGFTSGSQSLKLSVGNKAHTINFSISSADTNQSAQKKIADAINSKNAGVKASVVYNDENKTSSLVLESIESGIDKEEGEVKFSVSSSYGNAVEKTGINEISQYAQNAKYTIDNGAEKISKTNDIDIGNGITVTLKSAGDANVTMGKDNAAAVSDVTNMVKSFNELLAASELNKNDKRTSSLYTQLTNMTKNYAASLSRVGIDVTSGGYLKINESKLKTASENGSLEKFIVGDKGQSYGFANRLLSTASKVDSNPANYATTSSLVSNDFYLNSHQLARYSSYENMGLLLNMIV